MNIRKYHSDDLQAVLDINMAAFTPIHEAFRQILGDEIYELAHPNWRESNAIYIKSLATDDADNIHIAEDQEKIVGFIHFTMNMEKRSGEIGLNAVRPAEQGKGYGRQMYEFALQRMREEGIRLVGVSTGGDDSHIPACRAYESVGFVRLPLARYALALRPLLD